MNKQDGESCGNCCCKSNSCGTGQWGSLGRILLGVIVLSAIFFWGVKAGMSGGNYGMMNGREGKFGRGERGCFGDNDERGTYKKMKQRDTNVAEVAAPAAVENIPTEEVAPTEEVVAPTEEATQ